MRLLWQPGQGRELRSFGQGIRKLTIFPAQNLRKQNVLKMPPDLTESFITEKLRIAWNESGGKESFNEADNPQGKEPKCAAVLIPLTWFEDEWHLLYTRRTDKVETHKGQVSFPGGACDPGEATPEQTALREAEEEVTSYPAARDELRAIEIEATHAKEIADD